MKGVKELNGRDFSFCDALDAAIFPPPQRSTNCAKKMWLHPNTHLTTNYLEESTDQELFSGNKYTIDNHLIENSFGALKGSACVKPLCR